MQAHHLCLDTISVFCFYFQLVWLGNKVLSKGSNCAVEVCSGRHADCGIALSLEGRRWIPLVGKPKVHVGEQQVLGLRGWLVESFSVLQDVEIVRKEKTTIIQFTLFSKRNVIKCKKWVR